MSDRVDDFITLPREKQLTVLQKLSPDMQTQLLGEVKQRRSKSSPPPPPTTSPPQQPGFLEAHPGENPVAAFFRGGIGAAKSMVMHPVQTGAGMVEGALASGMSPIGEGYPSTAATGRMSDLEANRQVQTDAQEGQRQQAEFIKENPAYAAGGVILPALALHSVGKGVKALPKTALLERMRKGTQRMVGAGERAVKSTVEKTANAAGESAKTTEEKNRAALSKHTADVKEADQSNVNAHVKYLADKAEAEQANAAAKAVPDSRAALDREISGKSTERQAKIVKAQKAAKDDLDKRFEDQRELLGDEEIPDTYKNGAIQPNELSSVNIGKRTIDAYQAYQTNPDPTLPKELKELQNRAGEKLGWRELQGIRTRLSKQLSSGKLNGEVYQGYKAALGVVDDGLQKIADNMGVGDQVRKNRADYAHYMQTFHDPISEPNTVARKTQTSTSPEYMRGSEETERRGMLDKYDPSIGKIGQEIDSLSGRLSSLPSESTRPKAEIPKYPEGREVEPPKTNPIEVPKLNTRDIRADLVRKWTSGESTLNKFQVSRLIGSTVFGTVIGAVFGHGVGTEVGSAAGAASYALSPAIISRLLESPKVAEWITRPPPGELEALQKLPYADRIKLIDGLKRVTEEGQRRGISVSPAILALFNVRAGLHHTQELKKTREQQLQPTP